MLILMALSLAHGVPLHWLYFVKTRLQASLNSAYSSVMNATAAALNDASSALTSASYIGS